MYVIQYRRDGFVADYNADERSCEWVVNAKIATRFHTKTGAQWAADRLDLDPALVELWPVNYR